MSKQFLTQPFLVSPLLCNNNVQSVISKFLPFFKSKNLQSKRKYVDLCDGSKIAIDCIQQDNWKHCPTIIVLDGFLGSSTSSFSLGMAHKAYYFGFNVLLVNQRGQGGTFHLTKSLCDPGLTGDLSVALKTFMEWGYKKFYLVGSSHGGFLALKELLDNPQNEANILGLVAISSYIDTLNVSRYSQQHTILNWVLIREMNKMVKKRAKLDLPGTWDLSKLKSIKTIRDWDKAFMYNWCNFQTVEEFYQKVNLLPLIPRLNIPTLCIHSFDDQVVPVSQYETKEIKNNPHITTLLTQHGGHSGFVTDHKNSGDLDSYWAQNRAMEFFRLLENHNHTT